MLLQLITEVLLGGNNIIVLVITQMVYREDGMIQYRPLFNISLIKVYLTTHHLDL